MKRMRKLIAGVLCLSFVLSFAGCSDKTKKDNEQTDETQKPEYKETWVIEPSIEADNIFSLPLYKFNDKTNHYDVTYGDAYVIEKDGKFGFIDSNGKIIVEPKYDSIETCHCTDGYIATVKPEGSYSTTYKINASFGENWMYPHNPEECIAYTYKWNVALDKIHIQLGEEEVDGENYLPEAVFLDNGKFALAVNGELKSEEYDDAGIFTGGLVAMKKGDKWGYINSKGETVIPFEYEAAEGHSLNGMAPTPYEVSEGFVTVIKGDKSGVLKADGSEVIPCQYQKLTTVHDGRVFATNDGGVWGLLLVDEAISNGIANEMSQQETTETTQ